MGKKKQIGKKKKPNIPKTPQIALQRKEMRDLQVSKGAFSKRQGSWKKL